MKKYLVITIHPSWLAKSLDSSIEDELNKKTAEGYELVNIGFTVDSENKPIAIITFRK